MAEIRTIYVTQYGAFWKFSIKQWRAFVMEAINRIQSGNGYCLPPIRSIQARPRSIRIGMSRNDLYSVSSRVRIVQPLDWTLAHWIDELKEIGS